jgi:PleD family two-component response regulator
MPCRRSISEHSEKAEESVASFLAAPFIRNANRSMRYRLLVAGNSPRRVERLKTILSAPDYSLEVVSDGTSAFELASTDAFDLILIARLVPPTTGWLRSRLMPTIT